MAVKAIAKACGVLLSDDESEIDEFEDPVDMRQDVVMKQKRKSPMVRIDPELVKVGFVDDCGSDMHDESTSSRSSTQEDNSTSTQSPATNETPPTARSTKVEVSEGQ